MNNLKIIIRNLKKKSLLTALRFISIMLGVGVALYIFEINSRERSFDNFWPDADNIYRVALVHEEAGEVITHSAKNFLGAAELMKAEVPGVKAAVGFGKDKINIFCNEQQFNNVNWFWADTSFFSVLQLTILKSESEHLWHDIHGAIISKSFAKKLYGDQDPINQKFKLNEGWEFYVKAVFDDIPENSHLCADVISSRASLMYYIRNFNNTTRELVDNSGFSYSGINPYNQGSWGTPYTYRRFTYFQLADGVDIEQVKNAMPAAFAKINKPPRYKDASLKFEFQPIKSIHLHSNLEQEFKANGSAKRVQFLYLIAAVILLVSFINFLNLTNIQTIENGKSFAVQVLNGAQLSSIFKIIFVDNLLITLCAGALGVFVLLAFAGNLLPQNSISFFDILVLFFALFAISTLSVIVPYFRSLHGKFQTYLKTRTGSLPGNWEGRRFMVIIQFCIAILLISGTVLVGKQMKFMSEYRLGFQPQQTMFSFSPMSMNWHPELLSRLAAFKNEVEKVPGVKSFAVSSSVPGQYINRTSDNVRLGKDSDPLSESFSRMSVSCDFMKLFNLELLAGRNFNKQANWSSNEVMINSTALKVFGFLNPVEAISEVITIGNQDKQIVGVVSDYNHLSLKNKIQPLIIEQNLNWDHGVGYYCVRFNAERTAEVHQAVSEIWERIYPIEVANFQFTDEVFFAQYQEEKKFLKITTLGSLLALFISCIGLFAIAAFDTQKRIKEIGVRKVNGARVMQILAMLNKDFVKWVAVAFIVACPLAWYVTSKWLENFAYKTTLSWWVFALAGGMALGIALLTVTWQSWRAATRNPVEALRYE